MLHHDAHHDAHLTSLVSVASPSLVHASVSCFSGLHFEDCSLSCIAEVIQSMSVTV